MNETSDEKKQENVQSTQKVGFWGRSWSFLKGMGQKAVGSVMKVTSYIPCCRLIDGYNKAADEMLSNAEKNFEICASGSRVAKVVVGVTEKTLLPTDPVVGVVENSGKAVGATVDGNYTEAGLHLAAATGSVLLYGNPVSGLTGMAATTATKAIASETKDAVIDEARNGLISTLDAAGERITIVKNVAERGNNLVNNFNSLTGRG